MKIIERVLWDGKRFVYFVYIGIDNPRLAREAKKAR